MVLDDLLFVFCSIDKLIKSGYMVRGTYYQVALWSHQLSVLHELNVRKMHSFIQIS